MKLAAAALTLLLLTGMAHAQTGTGINLWADDKLRDPEVEAKQREIDKAYKEKIKSQTAPAVAADPWGTVRASDKPASQSKAQSGSKTGNTAR
jgi:hypothetical protein